MIRDELVADVHPDEVANYSAGGWVEVESGNVSPGDNNHVSAILDHLTKTQPDAKPKVADVEAALGIDVSGADVTDAWRQYKGETE